MRRISRWECAGPLGGINHYDQSLTPAQKADLVEFLKAV
jgi:hypothetical protein